MQTTRIELHGDIGIDVTLANIMGAVKLYPDNEIEFVVRSWGGYVDEAWRIYNYLETVSNVSVIFKDYCCSATTFAFLSLPVAKRKAFKNTQFAIHLPFNSYMFEDMNVEDLETNKERLQAVTNEINACYEKHLNLTQEEIQNLISPDSFFNETAAQGFQMISEILESEDKQDQNDYSFDLVFAKTRIAAFYPKNKNNNQNTQKMTEFKEIKEELTGFKALLNEIKAFVFPKTKALTVSSEEGAVIEIEGDVLMEGATVTSETADGTYTVEYMDKKYTIVIEAKKVTTMTEIVAEPPADETEALKAEIEQLKADLAAAQAKNVTAEAHAHEVAAIKAEMAAVKEAAEKITSKCYNPDTNSFNFSGEFDSKPAPEASIGKSYAEKKRAEKESK